MAYIKHFIALLLTCGMQYACSFGLIVLGYYSSLIYIFGGFIIWIIVFGSIRKLFFWNEKNLSLSDQNKITISFQVIAFVVLIATFFINRELSKVEDEYEYDNYGEIAKVAVAKKYSSRTGKGAKIDYILLSFTKNNQKISRKFRAKKGEEEKLNVGDSITIMYSTRNTYFTEKFTKIIP